MSKIQKISRKDAILPWMKHSLPSSFSSGLELNKVPGISSLVTKTLISNFNITKLFNIQTAVWNYTSGGLSLDNDLCICSPTGTGKTLAYALPLTHRVSHFKIKEKHNAIRAIIILPTRDLARQVYKIIEVLFLSMDLKLSLIAGDCNLDEEATNMGIISSIKGIPNITSKNNYKYTDGIIVTPGRLTSHIKNTPGFDLSYIQVIVVDEADRLLRQQYHNWVKYLELFTNNSIIKKRILKIIVSATLTRDPSKLDKLNLVNPRFISSGSKDQSYSLPKKLKEYKLVCPVSFKLHTLLALILKIKGDNLKNKQIIIFTSTVEITHRLTNFLKEIYRMNYISYIPVEYSSKISEISRINSLNKFTSGEASILIASDGATRGIDIDNVYTVINYDAPVYAKTYVHRAGRTARAGKEGMVITLLRREEVKHFKSILRKTDNNYVKDFIGITREDVDFWKPIVSLGIKNIKK